jgi:hypothetical protein
LPDVGIFSAIHAAIVAAIRRKGKLFNARNAANTGGKAKQRNPLPSRQRRLLDGMSLYDQKKTISIDRQPW